MLTDSSGPRRSSASFRPLRAALALAGFALAGCSDDRLLDVVTDWNPIGAYLYGSKEERAVKAEVACVETAGAKQKGCLDGCQRIDARRGPDAVSLCVNDCGRAYGKDTAACQ